MGVAGYKEVWLSQVEVWNLDTVLASKPVLPLARSDCKDGVISLDNIHDDVSITVCRETPSLLAYFNNIGNC